METSYREGNLIRIRTHNQSSICVPIDLIGIGKRQAREYAMTALPLGFEKSYRGLEEKVGLVVKVNRNRLDQPQGYQVQIGQDVWFFKSVLAQKYFELVGDTADEERRSC